MRTLVSFLTLCGFLVVGLQHPAAQDRPGQAGEFRQGVVVSVSAPASDVGLTILKDGGNAVDAAVATAFALAVTHPAAGNIGGGGFMLVHPASGEPTVIDYRETAPAAATKDMFKKGDSHFGPRVVGVPGTVRGLAMAHKKYGKLPWNLVVRPAVKLAEDGFALDAHHASSLNKILAKAGADFPEFRRVYGRFDQQPWSAGDRLTLPDLGRTLRRIADQGSDGFYTGTVAAQIVAEMRAGGGLITAQDLADYRAMERRPIHGVYRGFDVYAPPPPSSGGICLVQMLHTLENFDLRKHGWQSAQTLHLMVEAMRRAFRDRAAYLGDPAFVKFPEHLLSREYGKKLAESIDPTKSTRSEALAGDIPLAPEGDSTTHFSVIDKEGMAVANTYTLEHSYGCRVVVKGAGFLLNNEMMDFNWHPGVTDRKGGIGTPANEIAPGKRMLSSQCPTILARDGKVVLVTGSPGGRTIINTVLGIVLDVVDFGMPIREAVDAPRLHHAWLPDTIEMEGPLARSSAAEGLRKLGHQIAEVKEQGDAHSIWVDRKTGVYIGAADKRLSGKVSGY